MKQSQKKIRELIRKDGDEFDLYAVPKIAPTAQTSTPLVYLVDPNKISGARYHRVALKEYNIK